MYYCFSRPQLSFVVFARYSILFHKLSCPILPFRHFFGVKEALFPMRWCTPYCFTMFANHLLPIFSLVSCGTFFLKALSSAVRSLISCCCLKTVSNDTARLAANSASGPPWSYVCVDAAAILLRYPSSESVIWWVSCAPFVCVLFFVPPKITEPPKGFSSPLPDVFRASLCNISLLEGSFPFFPGLFTFLEFWPFPHFWFVLTWL